MMMMTLFRGLHKMSWCAWFQTGPHLGACGAPRAYGCQNDYLRSSGLVLNSSRAASSAHETLIPKILLIGLTSRLSDFSLNDSVFFHLLIFIFTSRGRLIWLFIGF